MISYKSPACHTFEICDNVIYDSDWTLKIKNVILLIIVTFFNISWQGCFARVQDFQKCHPPPPHNFHQRQLPRVFGKGVRLWGDFACLSEATSAVTAQFSKSCHHHHFWGEQISISRYKILHQNPHPCLWQYITCQSGSDVCGCARLHNRLTH